MEAVVEYLHTESVEKLKRIAIELFKQYWGIEGKVIRVGNC
jgi:hypothetical protein